MAGPLGVDFRGVYLVVMLTHDLLDVGDHRPPRGFDYLGYVMPIGRQLIEVLDLRPMRGRLDSSNHLLFE